MYIIKTHSKNTIFFYRKQFFLNIFTFYTIFKYGTRQIFAMELNGDRKFNNKYAIRCTLINIKCEYNIDIYRKRSEKLHIWVILFLSRFLFSFLFIYIYFSTFRVVHGRL